MNKKNEAKHHKLIVICFISILFCYFPFLHQPLMGDDVFHALILKKIEFSTHAYFWLTDLYKFSDGSQAYIAHMIEKAGLVWWTNPELKVHFFRPLSALSHKIDYIFWPNSKFMMHVHNLVWYLICVWLVFSFYSRTIKTKVIVAIATFIFSICFFHIFSVAWIAARNVIISACLILTTAIFFIDSLRFNSRFYYGLSLLFALLSLLSGESGITFLAFVFVLSLFFSNVSLSKTIIKMIPFGVIVGIYLYFYYCFGFGSSGSSFYISPQDGLFVFIRTVIFRLPEYILLNIFGIKKAWILNALSQQQFFILSLFTIALSSWFFLKRLTQDKTKTIKPFIFIYILCLLPFCASEPNMRALFIPSILSSAIIAIITHSTLLEKKIGDIRNIMTTLLLFLHIALPICAFSALYFYKIKKPYEYQAFTQYLKQNDIAETDSVLVFNNDMNITLVGGGSYLLETGKQPKQLINMLSAKQAFYIQPLSEKKIRVASIEKQPLLSHTQDIFGRIHLSVDHTFSVGDTYRLSNIEITVERLDVKTNTPNSLLFTFAKNINTPSYKWLYINQNAEIQSFQLEEMNHKYLFNEKN